MLRKSFIISIFASAITACGISQNATKDQLTMKEATAQQPVVSVREVKKTLVLENSFSEISINLKRGTWSGKDKTTGTVVFKDAMFRLDQSTGSHWWKDPKTEISWSKAETTGKLGKGTTVTVKFTPKEAYDPIRMLNLTLYPDKPFVEIGWGVQNQKKYPVRVKNAEVLYLGALFNGQQVEDPQLLKSGAGGERNLIEKTWKTKAYNGVMLTYKDKGKRRTMVVGGLDYKEFGRHVELQEDKRKFKYMNLKCWDPQGKLIPAGTTYTSPDSFYLDFVTVDPFKSLEQYGMAMRKANNASPNNYDFPTLCGWMVSTKHLGEGRELNNSPELVKQVEIAKTKGLMKYTPFAVRLEPDFYMQGDHGNTQQGWYDDAHWQKYGAGGNKGPVDRALIGTGKGSLRAPYETFAKFCGAVKDLGGKTFTYFQANMPSHDFSMAHPEWMINNDISQLHVDHRHSKPLVRMDFSDPGLRDYMLKMWQRLRRDGLNGVKFDYPATNWVTDGGFEDKSFTTTSHYREVFRLCREGLGKEAFLHERNLTSPRQDVTAGLLDLQRVWGDASHFAPEMASRIGMRWYKSRSVFLYYPDGKSFYSHGKELPAYKRRAFLTLIAFLSGRLELGTSVGKMTDEMFYDTTRLFPMLGGTKSPRPVDMLQNKVHPETYIYEVAPGWSQVLLVNNDAKKTKTISAPISGDQVETGSLGLDANAEYHAFDFWSQKYLGKLKGTDKLAMKLRGGEVAMISVRKVAANPQTVSTNRHIMQGMMECHDVKWCGNALTGKVDVVKDEEFVLTIACNGRTPKSCKGAEICLRKDNSNLVDLTFNSDKTETRSFILNFK